MPIDKLGGDTYPIGGLADTTFKHVPHAEFTSNPFYVDHATLVGKARIARDDEKAVEA